MEEKKKKKRMPTPLIDKIILDPLERYVKYDKYPTKLLIHFIVLVLSTAQILLIINYTGSYSRSAMRVFFKNFMNDEMALNELDINNKQFFYDLDEFRQHVNDSVNNYYDLGESTSIDKYEYLYFENEATEELIQESPRLSAYFIRNDNRKIVPEYSYNLTAEDLGPFEWDDEELRMFISNTTNIKLQYQIKHCIPSESTTPFDCFKWIITQDFDYSSRNHITEKLSFEKHYLNILTSNDKAGSNPSFLSTYIWLNILNIVFALYSLILHILHFKQIQQMYTKMRKRYKIMKSKAKVHKQSLSPSQPSQPSQPSPAINSDADEFKDMPSSKDTSETMSTIGRAQLDWDALTLSDKAKLFNEWTFVIMLGDILLIIGSLFLIASTSTAFTKSSAFLGFSSLCHWAATLKYMENIKGYNIVANTFINSAGIVVKAMAGVIPLFLAFVIFGMCTFIESNRFGSISVSMYVLYSYMNGDSIFDIYYDIQQLQFLLAFGYCIIFIFTSNAIVQNVFIVIIGDAYVKSKYYHKNDWIRPIDEKGYTIKNDEEEDPLEAFYSKTQKEIESRKALVKMLQQDKEIIEQEYRKKKILMKGNFMQKGRITRILDKVKEDEEEVKLDHDQASVSMLKISIIKYLIVLNDVFEKDLKGKPEEQLHGDATNEVPEEIKVLKEDVYDRYVN
jgi:hypothetical protein